MKSIFSLVSRFGLLYSTLWARRHILETRIKITKMVNGILILCLSAVFWFIGFMMIFGSLFFYLSELSKYSVSSLLAGSLSLGLGLIISLMGLYCLRVRD